MGWDGWMDGCMDGSPSAAWTAFSGFKAKSSVADAAREDMTFVAALCYIQ